MLEKSDWAYRRQSSSHDRSPNKSLTLGAQRVTVGSYDISKSEPVTSHNCWLIPISFLYCTLGHLGKHEGEAKPADVFFFPDWKNGVRVETYEKGGNWPTCLGGRVAPARWPTATPARPNKAGAGLTSASRRFWRRRHRSACQYKHDDVPGLFF